MGTALIVLADRGESARIESWFVAGLGELKEPLRPLIRAAGEPALLEEPTPVLVLVDLAIPVVDRFRLEGELRANPATRDVPIVELELAEPREDDTPHLSMTPQARVSRPLSSKDLSQAIGQAFSWKSTLADRGLHLHVELFFHSIPVLMHEAVDYLTGLLKRTPLRAEQIRQLRHVLIEMGQNAIEWGHRYHVDSIVRVLYLQHADRVELIVRDEGPGFNPETLPHAAADEDPVRHLELREQLGLREGGFGLMICRGLVDELRYNAKGNEVTLVKKFEDAAGPKHSG